MIHAAWARWRAFTLARAGRAQCTPVLGLLACAAVAAIVCWHYRHGIITGVKITAAVLACAAVIFLALLALGFTRDQLAGRRERRLALARAETGRACAAALAAPVTAGADGHLDPAATADRFELSADGVTTLPAGHPGPVTP
jgi:hypothetical protein